MAIQIHPIQQRLANKHGKMFPVIKSAHAEYPADKGKYRGHCNRSACLAPNPVFYNHAMRAYYCNQCADILNAVAVRDEYMMPRLEIKLDGTEDPDDPEHIYNMRIEKKWATRFEHKLPQEQHA